MEKNTHLLIRFPGLDPIPTYMQNIKVLQVFFSVTQAIKLNGIPRYRLIPVFYGVESEETLRKTVNNLEERGWVGGRRLRSLKLLIVLVQ